MRRVASVVAGIALAVIAAAPVLAIDFPEQGKPHSCAVVTSLPKDVVGHLFTVSPAAAQKLLALLADACG